MKTFERVAPAPLDESSYVDCERFVARFVFGDRGAMARALGALGLAELAGTEHLLLHLRVADIDVVATTARSPYEITFVVKPNGTSSSMSERDCADAEALDAALVAAGLAPFRS